MFEATSMLFINVETPVHAGTGQALGVVDLPIQRERTTCYPMIQASSIRGRLRAEADRRFNPSSTFSQKEFSAIFGPDAENASDHAGALSIGDARILLFPVRSLAGVFAFTTSADVLHRFIREATIANIAINWQVPLKPERGEAWINGNSLVAGDSVVLEEFSFEPRQDHSSSLEAIGTWLADHALLPMPEYSYWKEILPKKLCILPEDDFRDFTQHATEVRTHICLDREKKTVQTRALWTSESLPVDTLLYALLMATRSRNSNVPLSGQQVLEKLRSLNLSRTQLGGDETTGQGMVTLRIAGDKG